MAMISEHFFSNNNRLDKIRQEIYLDAPQSVSARFEKLVSLHRKTFNAYPDEMYSSPGRIEIVGNHTDHNGGKVLAAAVTVDTLACVTRRGDGVIEIKSEAYPTLRADINDYAFSSSEIGTSTALVKGILDYFKRSGKKIGGFSASTDSCVPKGAGVSSSSAFELAVAEILNVLYNDGVLDAVFKAKAAQYAENIYFGKPCGLMDQTAIALGGVNLIDFKSFDNPEIMNAEWRFKDLDIYVIATGGDHCDLTDEYAAIPAEMKQVASLLGARLLHEVPYENFLAKKKEIADKVSARAISRAEHFYEENIRVERAFKAVKDGDEAAFLDAVNKSGESSREKLKNTYSEKSGNKNIENALDFVKTVDGVKAERVHGGGFAGTILVFVKKEKSDEVKKAFVKQFGEANVFCLGIREHGAIKLPL